MPSTTLLGFECANYRLPRRRSSLGWGSSEPPAIEHLLVLTAILDLWEAPLSLPRAESLFYCFRFEEQILENHLLRLIDRYVDFSFVQERLRPLCSLSSKPTFSTVSNGSSAAWYWFASEHPLVTSPA